MGSERHQPRDTPSEHHAPLPIVRITIDDAVLVIGVLELVGEGLDPDSDLGILVRRSAARIGSRLQSFTDSLSAPVSPIDERGRRTTALDPRSGERPQRA